MPTVVVVGAQWGDEGKGKIIDLFTPFADAVVRFGGGANAGHTLVVEGEKVVFHLMPSGALHEHVDCVLAHGTVLDPVVLLTELSQLQARGLLERPRVWVSERAHVVLPQHVLVDGLRESGRNAIGTTKRGIGPAYEDKVARRGIRVGDLLRPAFLRDKLEQNLDAWRPLVTALGGSLPELAAVEAQMLELGRRLAPYVIDTCTWILDAVHGGKRVLLEGAQGSMLDIDVGTYPFVTSSSVVAAGACTGTGLPPKAVDRVVGITKAYATRVGSGPFPTELLSEEGDRLRKAGAEFGSTTGRPRRCGWIDAVALRHAVRINGIDELVMTKLDVLAGMPEVRVCVGYELDGQRIDSPPFEGLDRVVPVWETLEGFESLPADARSVDALPAALRKYVRRLEELTECHIELLSVGADRTATIGAADPFHGL